MSAHTSVAKETATKEEAMKWPIIQEDAIKAKQRKEFDDLDKKLRADLAALKKG